MPTGLGSRQTFSCCHPSTTLLDRAVLSGMFRRSDLRTLYKLVEFARLMRGDRSHGDRTDSAVDALARVVPAVFRSSRAAARPADLRARRGHRQRPQVDAGDAV